MNRCRRSVWFKLDDRFHSHWKVVAAGNAAIGLWVRCCTWSADYKRDGKVPADIARMYGTADEMGALADAGLWLPNGDGFVVPDFLEYNPKQNAEHRAQIAGARRVAGMTRAANANRDEHGHFT